MRRGKSRRVDRGPEPGQHHRHKQRKKAQTLEAQVDGLARIPYLPPEFPSRIVLKTHRSSRALEGKGLAAKLARTRSIFAAPSTRVVSHCHYVSAFIREHAEYHDLVSADDLQNYCRSAEQYRR